MYSAISSPLLPFSSSHPSASSFSLLPAISSLSKSYIPSFPLLSVSLRAKPLHAIGKPKEQISESASISIDNDVAAADDLPDASNTTCFVIRARNKIGLLQIITRVFKVLGLRIEKATVEIEGEFFVKRFFVTDSHGKKIDDPGNLDRIEKALRDALDGSDGVAKAGPTAVASRGFVARRPGFLPDLGEKRAKAERLFGLMDGFLKNDPISLQKDILDHVEYTIARSRFNFDDFEAYQALSHSVRDRLIERWHDTQQYFKRKDPKRLYFLSLEFLMGRSLSNSVINLGIRDQYADALNQLGFEYEVLAEQVEEGG